MASAASKVFSTPEVLELILADLPRSDLLLSRRTCSTFNNVIDTSPILKEALFLRPSSSAPYEGEHWTIIPLLRKHFLPFFDESSHNHSALRQFRWTTIPSRRRAVLRREASWRRMALTSPSSHVLHLARCTRTQDVDRYDVACMSFDATSGGITMGAVYDIVQSWCSNYPDASWSLFVESKEHTGKVDVTLYLEMEIQCCMNSDTQKYLDLRSEGEEVTAQKLEWRDSSEEEYFEILNLQERRNERLAERATKKREVERMERRLEKARKRGVAVEEVSDVEEERIQDEPSLWDLPDSCGIRSYRRCPCGRRRL